MRERKGQSDYFRKYGKESVRRTSFACRELGGKVSSCFSGSACFFGGYLPVGLAKLLRSEAD